MVLFECGTKITSLAQDSIFLVLHESEYEDDDGGPYMVVSSKRRWRSSRLPKALK